MPTRQLQQHLQELHQQLTSDMPLDDGDKASLVSLMHDIETRLTSDIAPGPETNLVNEVELAVERFEESHPTLSGSLRTILQTLSNMGI